jgi:type VI secretion system Hcp family effector
MKAHILILLSALFTFAAPLTHAAAYIKFDGIDGEVVERDHKGWVDLQSMSVIVHKPGGTAATLGRASLKDFTCSSPIGKASPKLAEAVAKGTRFATVMLSLRLSTDGTRAVYLRYELKNVLVSSYSTTAHTDAAGGAARVSESYSLNFEEIKITYVGADGATATGAVGIVAAQ